MIGSRRQLVESPVASLTLDPNPYAGIQLASVLDNIIRSLSDATFTFHGWCLKLSTVGGSLGNRAVPFLPPLFISNCFPARLGILVTGLG